MNTLRIRVLILNLFIVLSTFSQDVIYTVSGDYNGGKTPLDSIIVDNITNGTRISFGDLPEHDYYQINLTQNAYWGSVSAFDLEESSDFIVKENSFGKLSVLYGGSSPAEVKISIINVNGQTLFIKDELLLRSQQSLLVKLGSEGVYFVKIESLQETITFKALGGAAQDDFNVEIGDGGNTKSVYSSKLKSITLIGEGDFNFEEGDSIRIWAFKKDIYAWPEHMRIKESGDVNFQFEDTRYIEEAEQAYPDSIGELIPFAFEDETFYCEKINNEYVFQEDIILTEEQLFGDSTKGAWITALFNDDVDDRGLFINFWPDATVYYEIDESLENDERLETALNYWNLNAPIFFKHRNNEDDYVIFVDNGDDGSKSHIGMIFGPQHIFIDRDAEYGSIVHEMGHTVGLIHEHTRSDRNDYLEVHWENIDDRDWTDLQIFDLNFKRFPSSINVGPFDFSSIMLYGSYAGSKDLESPVLKTKDDKTFQAQRTALSYWDIKTLEELYDLERDEKPKVNVYVTYNESNTNYMVEGDVVSEGDSPITSKSIAWKKVGDANYNHEYFYDLNGDFSIEISDVSCGDEILVYAAATNSSGTSSSPIRSQFINPHPIIEVSEISSSSAHINLTYTTDECVESVGLKLYESEADASAQKNLTNHKFLEKNNAGYGVDLTDLTPEKDYFMVFETTYYLTSNGVKETYSSDVESFKTNKDITTPVVQTNAAINITTNSAIINGNVTSDGGSTITQRGFYWSSTDQTPDLDDNLTTVSGTTGSYSKSLTGLTPNTTYYYNAFATNSQGTTTGSVQSFKTNQDITAPVVQTNAATTITTNSATLNGNVTSDGGSTIIQRGFYRSASDQTPDSNDNPTIVSGTTGNFSENLTGLDPNTTYYYAAFATNSIGTSVGAVQSFKTNQESQANSGTFTDSRDGNTYKWVKIGEQVWMAENLAYKTNESWAYDNNESNVEIYGRLYTWDDAKTACPSGWHLPTDDEWKQLEMTIGMSQSEADVDGQRGTNEGTKLKAASGWNNNGNGTDDFGFSGLPGGSYFFLDEGSFEYIGKSGEWWTATQTSTSNAKNRLLSYTTSTVSRYTRGKEFGYSVRCIKD